MDKLVYSSRKDNKRCYKDCKKCKQSSVRVDDKGYLFGYECMKYDEYIDLACSNDTKDFAY